NLTLVPSSRDSKIRWRLLAAGLTLGLAFLCQTARAQQGGPAPTPGSFGAAVLALDPLAFWQLNETNPVPVLPATLTAYDYTGHGYNGTYLPNALNGADAIYAPSPTGTPAFPGFASLQGALEPTTAETNSVVALPPLNLETNAVTILMWISPASAIGNYMGLLGNRNSSGDAAIFGFGGSTGPEGVSSLGYTWNTNNSDTWGWNTGLYPPIGNWSFVALVTEPTQATIYMYYIDLTTGSPVLGSAVNSVASDPEAFSTGGIFLGSDVQGSGAYTLANNEFGGLISDAAVFKKSLTPAQILNLFGVAVGQTGF